MERIKTDLVVLGSGGSGMAAAITAAEGGAKVVVLEKRPFTGGASNTPIGLGYVKKEQALRDKAFKVHMDRTRWTANADLVKAWIDISGEIPEWLGNMGVPITIQSQRRPLADVGEDPAFDARGMCALNAVGRGHGGAQMIKAMVAKAKELGVDVRVATPAKKILRIGDRITGVLAEDKAGEVVRVDAKAVVVATAGFNEDEEMIKRYGGFDFTLDRFGDCEGGDYFNLCLDLKLTGDGIKMAWQVGADKGPMGIPVWPHVPGPGIIGNMPWIMLSQLRIIQEQPYLWVNQEGRRFMNEEIVPRRLPAGNLIARQKGKCAILIFDDDTRKHLEEEAVDCVYFIFPADKLADIEGDMRRVIAQGNKHVFIADTLEELARQADIPPVVLKNTIDEYNGFCDRGHDDQYSKSPKFLRPVKKRKYYGVRVYNTAYGTVGGIKVNGKTEALTREGQAIPGLYAAGDIIVAEVLGKPPTLGLQNLGFAVSSGRIAGKSALEYIKGAV